MYLNVSHLLTRQFVHSFHYMFNLVTKAKKSKRPDIFFYPLETSFSAK